MKLSLSAISTVNAAFAEDVEAYAAAGFDAIGLWEMKLPADDAANRALLAEHGLGVSNCVPTVPSFLQLGIPGLEGPADPAERLEAICGSIERLAAYEPECVLVLSGPAGERSAADRTRDRRRRADPRRCGRARHRSRRSASSRSIPSQRETAAFVCSLADALALLDEAGLDDVGIMADTYNLAHESARRRRRRSSPRLAGPPRRRRAVARATSPASACSRARVTRAHGRSVVQALRVAGWDGTLDVEIFSTPDGFWSLPVDEAARRAHAAAAELVT